MQIELILLVVSILFFASILATKAGNKLGVPSLLLFLGVGMLFGSDGLGIHFDNIKITQIIGTVCLSAILFSGGLDTKFKDIRPVLGPGIMLATLGVLITAVGTGLVLYFFLHGNTGASLLSCLLLAATMSSTDSASVFSILRGKGLSLKHNLRPTLELESGSNDPMAYVLVLTLINIILQGGSPSWGSAILMLFTQLIIGALMGWLLGKAMVWIINKIDIDNASLYPILVLSGSFFIFSLTYFLKGNSYLAVYIAGLIVGNSKFVHKRSTRSFFDGISWLSQLAMFLTLGLLVNPSELKTVLLPGLGISFVMIFITRPLSVFLSLLPFKKYTFKDRVFVSWVGLRGAVPIIFAILCRASGVEGSDIVFNIVFLCTLVSLVVQGTTLPVVAKWLDVSEEPEQSDKRISSDFDIEFPEEIKSATSEVEITPRMLEKGSRLMDIGLPEKTLAIIVKRGENYFVPTGKTILMPEDRMMILSDNQEALRDTLKSLGVEEKPAEEKKEKRQWINVFFDDEETS